MIAWQAGATLFLFRWIFRDPRVDVRFLVAGALIPDAIDIVLGTVVLGLSTGEAWAHSLLAPTMVTAAILLTTRRGRRRRAWMALAVGMYLHLLIDGMWATTEVFLWPLFGPIPHGTGPYWQGALDRALADPWRWVREIAGIAYLAWLWAASGLGSQDRRRRLLRTGILEPVT